VNAFGDDVDRLLSESASSLFSRHSDLSTLRSLPPGGWSPELWSFAEQAELPLVAVSGSAGGSDGTVRHWATVLRIAARHGAPIPLAETGVAGWLLEQAGLKVPSGPLTVGDIARVDDGQITAAHVPYGRHAAGIVLINRNDTGDAADFAVVPQDVCEIIEGVNLAGEPRDMVLCATAHLKPRIQVPPGAADQLRLAWAFARTVQMAGALDGLLELVVTHLRERVQFGTTIARLPVVRDRLALLAEEVAAAGAAADCASDGVSAGSEVTVGAAKVRAGEAAGEGTRLAHQLIGAIGMTAEHPLQLLTRRLWSWREESGNERWWAERIGHLLAELGPDLFWPTLVRAAH
jgi:acyl-CoA dehydrogenase